MVRVLQSVSARETSALTGLFLNLSVVAVLAALHYYLNDPHVIIHVGLLPILAMPVSFFAGIYGLRGVVLSMVASLGFLGDDLIHSHFILLLVELGQLGLIGIVAILIGTAARRESRSDSLLRDDIASRVAQLHGEPNYWQRVALTRMGVYVTRVEEQFLEVALSELQGDSVLLDVGAGSGRLEFVLLRSAERVIATDVNRGDLELMENDERLGRVHVGVHPSLPVQSESVQAVVAIEVPAASDKEWFKAECRRIVRPGGHIVVSVHNSRSYKGLWHAIRAGAREGRGEKWARLYYQKSLSDHEGAWRAAGFRIVDRGGLYWAPLSRTSNSRWVGVISVIERLFGLRRLCSISPWVLLHLQREDPRT